MAHVPGHRKGGSDSVKKSRQTRRNANKNRGAGTDKIKKKDKSCKRCDRMFKKTKKRRIREIKKANRIYNRAEKKEERRERRKERKKQLLTPVPEKSKNPRFM